MEGLLKPAMLDQTNSHKEPSLSIEVTKVRQAVAVSLLAGSRVGFWHVGSSHDLSFGQVRVLESAASDWQFLWSNVGPNI